MRRRRRKSQEQHSITLFPFLAVLICTFGVLIVLLVIVVKVADQSAEQERQAKEQAQQETITQMTLAVEREQIKIEAYTSVQNDLRRELNSEKNRQAQLQAELQGLSQQLELLAKQQKRLDEKDVTGAAELEDKIGQLKRQLADEQDLLHKRRKAVANEPTRTRYSVVPYSGDNGTDRIPIYIECREDVLEIRPYGIKLSPRDFVRPILPNNPLDAALLAVREYYLKNDLIAEGQSPYPLLIVRPGGADAYAIARHAIKSWDAEFGYELIDAEKDLDFGEADSQLAAAMKQAVQAAKRRQDKYIAQQFISQNRSGREPEFSGGFRASQQRGGFTALTDRGERPASELQSNTSGRFDTENGKQEDQQVGDQEDSEALTEADIAVRGINAAGESIAEERGSDWALPNRTRDAIPYHRPVKIFLSADKFVIEADSRRNRRQEIAIGNDMREATKRLVDAINKRIETWGVAGVGGFWKPELDIVAESANAARLYEQLRTLLDQSGIEIREQP